MAFYLSHNHDIFLCSISEFQHFALTCFYPGSLFSWKLLLDILMFCAVKKKEKKKKTMLMGYVTSSDSTFTCTFCFFMKLILSRKKISSTNDAEFPCLFVTWLNTLKQNFYCPDWSFQKFFSYKSLQQICLWDVFWRSWLGLNPTCLMKWN